MANTSNDTKTVIRALAVGAAMVVEQVVTELMESILDWAKSRWGRGHKPNRTR